MNREVHFELTREWALDEGYSGEEAEAIADANWACDGIHTRPIADKRYHFALAGAPVVAWRRYRRALRERDLTALGEALHALQDTIGHGVLGNFYHWQGIDRLENRSPGLRLRLETWSKRVLRAYREKVRYG